MFRITNLSRSTKGLLRRNCVNRGYAAVSGDILGFMKELQPQANLEVETAKSIFDPTSDGEDPSRQLQQQRIDHLIATRPMDFLLALPFVEDPIQMMDNWEWNQDKRPPLPMLYSSEFSLLPAERDSYYRLISYQLLRHVLVRRMSEGRSFKSWFSPPSQSSAELKANDLYITSTSELLYLKTLSQLYNINPREEIQHHAQSTAGYLVDAFDTFPIKQKRKDQLHEAFQLVKDDFGKLESRVG